MEKYKKALNDAIMSVNAMWENGANYGVCLFSLTDRINGITSLAVYDSISSEEYENIQVIARKLTSKWIQEHKSTKLF